MKLFTTEEKIDYIFHEIRRQKIQKKIKLFFRVFVVFFLILLYFLYVHPFDKNKLIKNASGLLGELVTPVVENLINNSDINPIDEENLRNEVIKAIQQNPDLFSK